MLRWVIRPFLVLAFLIAGDRLDGQVSPGPLARAHQSLEGSLSCTKCHGGGNVPMNSLCLDCHTEIRWLAQQGRGLHATNPVAPCVSCHPDHAGRDFAMIRWPEGSRDRFDHRRAGWPLEQAHAEVKCLECHTPSFRLGEAGRLSPRRSEMAGWVGLERACVSCHEDVHQKSLSARCDTCHDLKSWQLASRFDHVNSRYPLTGAHAEVTCAACHQPPSQGAVRNREGELLPRFKPLRFAQCSDCHRDPHDARLGPACDDCHVTRGFKVIGRERFNHERTRFPLSGRHSAVACGGCHTSGAPREWNPPFATCGACHADAHAGQATIAGKAADCDACHTVAGFRPGSYTVTQHRATKYPLQGRHAEVACASCHTRRTTARNDSLGRARVLMRPPFGTCLACHNDDHRGQLAQRAGSGACEGCHQVGNWKPVTYTAIQHAALRVTLAGKHSTLTCAACHGPDRPGLPPLATRDSLGRAGVALVLDARCASCHVDPHEGRFSPSAGRTDPRDCLGCHSYAGFRPSMVDVAAHQAYRWKLEGAHRAVACEACHQETKRGPLRSTLVRPPRTIPSQLFAVADTGCEDCHRTPHGTQFVSRRDTGRCEGCHTLDAFKPASRFNHNRDTEFVLDGAHANAPCEKCHKTERNGSTLVVRYRPLETRCESCHLEVPDGPRSR